ncbi:MAG: UDP-2,3-diacylglucosamine diphosphatase LpxG [Waddliaceae bacterium]
MKKNNLNSSFHFFDCLWDLWCIVSVIGIWPRFIEPNLISTTKLSLPIPNLPSELKNFRILQFSDLHLHQGVPDFFLKKLIKKVRKLNPDLIVFTGDFLCFSTSPDEARLKNLLHSFNAPYGCYAILGNHDYQQSVSIDEQGNYDIVKKDSSLIGKGFKRLFTPINLSKYTTPEARVLESHHELIRLLEETPFQLLDNKTKTIPVKGTALNLCGVGEHMLSRCRPEEAFQGYDKNYPGIILAHNPDCITSLHSYPGDVILCGHTHGGQVNLPWLWKKLIALENREFKRGLLRDGEKWIYVNRGIGSIIPFRWFSVPELLFLTLE